MTPCPTRLTPHRLHPARTYRHIPGGELNCHGELTRVVIMYCESIVSLWPTSCRPCLSGLHRSKRPESPRGPWQEDNKGCQPNSSPCSPKWKRYHWCHRVVWIKVKCSFVLSFAASVISACGYLFWLLGRWWFRESNSFLCCPANRQADYGWIRP